MTPQSAKSKARCSIATIDYTVYLEEATGKEYIKAREVGGTSRRLYKRVCIECGDISWLRGGKEHRTTCGSCVRKRKLSAETKDKISKTLRKKYETPSYKEMIAASQPSRKGHLHWNWKGGRTAENQKKRNSEEYHKWRTSVFVRDYYHCKLCHSNTNIAAHHILPWASFPEKRLEVSNGITLCENCHATIHTYLKEIQNITN